MKQEFQQAIVAARSGKVKEAQFLLAQVLQQDPQDAQAWFLLSNLVDDPALQQDYLGKVLAIAPDHEKAQAQMASLSATAVTDDLADLDRVMADMATAVDELPLGLDEADEEDDWLAATIRDEPVIREELPSSPPSTTMLEPEPAIAPTLKAAEEKQVVPSKATPAVKPSPPAKKDASADELAKLNRQLYLLVGLAAIVLLVFLLTLLL